MKPIIVGIDPGTTLGYAVLDCEGNLLANGSCKHFNLSKLITEVIKHGKPIIVGCDKARVPSFVEAFGAKVGAVVAYPRNDLLVKDKKELASCFNPNTDHERDAAASALFAYKQYAALFNKIDYFVKRNNKEKHKDKLICLVVLNEGLAITEALDIIEKPEEPETRVVRKVIEERQLNEKDFFRLYSKVKALEKENKMLKQQNFSLKQKLENIKPEKIRIIDKEAKDLLQFKEKRIMSLDKQLEIRDIEIDALKKEILILYRFLSDLKNNVLLKKFNTLSYNEFQIKNRLLQIQKNDVLYVQDVTVFSDKTISALKDVVHVIVYNKISQKILNKLPFIFVNASDLKILETNNYGIVSREQLESVKNTASLLSQIIGQYKAERK